MADFLDWKIREHLFYFKRHNIWIPEFKKVASINLWFFFVCFIRSSITFSSDPLPSRPYTQPPREKGYALSSPLRSKLSSVRWQIVYLTESLWKQALLFCLENTDLWIWLLLQEN